MKLIRLHAPSQSDQPVPVSVPERAVVTVGNFDGVHCGHKAVIEQAATLARARQQPLCVLIFEPLPREYFAEQRRAPTVARLTRLRERYHAFAALGCVDYLIVARFDAHLAAMPAECFVTDLLLGGLQASGVVIGDDFRFGAQRAGDFALLKALSAEYGFTALAANTFSLAGERVSSTRVRAALKRRDVATAATLLGRVYSLFGRVMHGDKRGRTLGFPTVNLALRRRQAPLNGVFLVGAVFTQHEHPPVFGVANIGTRPTVNGEIAQLEVHLLDFAQQVYGALLAVSFIAPIRAEQKFASLAALTEQIEQDKHSALDMLADHVAPCDGDFSVITRQLADHPLTQQGMEQIHD